MVYEIMGDLLTVDANIICHQVNYTGVMGAGIAAAIRDKVLTPEQYAEYVTYCNERHGSALGRTQFIEVDPGKKWVANMFSQSDHYLDLLGRLTNYTALHECLIDIRTFAEERGLSVAFPANLGCGIAAGDWAIVKSFILGLFSASPVPVYIVSRSKPAQEG